MNMDMNNQDKPEAIVPLRSESGEESDQKGSALQPVNDTESTITDIPTAILTPEASVLREQDNPAEIVADNNLPTVQETKTGPQKVNYFVFVKSFLSGLPGKLKFIKKSKNKLPVTTTNQDLPVENEDPENLVEKRLGTLFTDQAEPGIISASSEELPEENSQHNLILTNLSQDIVPEQPQPQNLSLPQKDEISPFDEYFENPRSLSPFLPENFDEPQADEKGDGRNEENSLVEDLNVNHYNQANDLSEDPDLNERFRSFLSSEGEETPDASQQPFITDDNDIPDASDGEKDITIDGLASFETMQKLNASEVELPENWNNPFTTDPITAIDEPTTATIETKETKDETIAYPPDQQKGLAQTTDLGINQGRKSLIIQQGLAQSENQTDENEDYLAIINEGLAQSSNTTEEEAPPNPWEIVPDWSTLADSDEKFTSTNLTEENPEVPAQIKPAPEIQEKGFIASIPILFKVLIVLLFVVDLAIIGIFGSSYVKIHLPIAPIATPAPTEKATYVYPNALKLTGGWIVQLNTGYLVNNKWTPVSAEWLIDTTFRRVVALPWSKQLEAVALTLKSGDPIDLYMVNNDVITYQVEQVIKVPQNDTSFLKRNTPGLIIILYQTDSQERWIIICGQK